MLSICEMMLCGRFQIDMYVCVPPRLEEKGHGSRHGHESTTGLLVVKYRYNNNWSMVLIIGCFWLPFPGVYFGWAALEDAAEESEEAGGGGGGSGGGGPWKCVANVGYSPTFAGQENAEKIVEGHLIGYTGVVCFVVSRLLLLMKNMLWLFTLIVL